MNKKSITVDFIYTVGATGIINFVLQCLVYPFINNSLGEEKFGEITFYMSIITIIGTAIGTATCNNRLSIKNKIESSDGDFLIILLSALIVLTLFEVVIMSFFVGALDVTLIVLLTILTCIRFYGCVQYRINLSYKKYFIYFLICSVGYVVGLILFYVTKQWELIFITGELIACIYLFFTGTCLRHIERSDNFNLILKTTCTLMLSLMIYEITINADRIILMLFDSPKSVSLYYTLATVPKILFLFSGPLNNILLSYVANDKIKMNMSVYLKYIVFSSIVVGVFFLFSLIGVPIFMKIFYPNMYNDTFKYYIFISLAVLLDLFVSLISNAVFAEFGSKYHLIIFGSYCVYFFAFAIIGTCLYGIAGYICGILVSEIIKIIVTITIGIRKFKSSN